MERAVDWRPYHRLDDGELLGYLMPDEGDLVVPVNLVGHPVGAAMDVFTAEQTLQDVGLSCLAEQWLLRNDDGSDQRVVIVEIDADQIVVSHADFGRISSFGERTTLAVPTDRLRPA